MIRIDALWLCTAPVDMRCGAERLLAQVVLTLGAARVHHGFGVWCAARRLNAGGFVRISRTHDTPTALRLTRQQFDALVLGLPWQRLPEMDAICRV